MKDKLCSVCEVYYSANLKKCPYCKTKSEADLRVWF